MIKNITFLFFIIFISNNIVYGQEFSLSQIHIEQKVPVSRVYLQSITSGGFLIYTKDNFQHFIIDTTGKPALLANGSEFVLIGTIPFPGGFIDSDTTMPSRFKLVENKGLVFIDGICSVYFDSGSVKNLKKERPLLKNKQNNTVCSSLLSAFKAYKISFDSTIENIKNSSMGFGDGRETTRWIFSGSVGNDPDLGVIFENGSGVLEITQYKYRGIQDIVLGKYFSGTGKQYATLSDLRAKTVVRYIKRNYAAQINIFDRSNVSDQNSNSSSMSINLQIDEELRLIKDVSGTKSPQNWLYEKPNEKDDRFNRQWILNSAIKKPIYGGLLIQSVKYVEGTDLEYEAVVLDFFTGEGLQSKRYYKCCGSYFIAANSLFKRIQVNNKIDKKNYKDKKYYKEKKYYNGLEESLGLKINEM